MKTIATLLLIGSLAACASSGSGNSEVYGQINTGIESVHTH